jgi:hypothetical protein
LSILPVSRRRVGDAGGDKTMDKELRRVMKHPLAVLHIPHASSIIPPEERKNITLSDEELQEE